VVIARLTDLDDDKQPDEIGMLTVIARQNAGADASILRPIYFRLNNAVAITGASERPTITVGIGMTIEAVEKGKIAKSGEVKLSNDISAIIGAETPVCVSAISETRPEQACPVATNLFVDPSPIATAFQLSVAVREVGSAAKINEGVKESTKALKTLTDPVFNEFLKQLAAAAKSN
jgi:hypothetical protein